MGEENAVVIGVCVLFFPLVFFWADFLQLTRRRRRRRRAGVRVIAEFHSLRSDSLCSSPCFPVVDDPSDGLLGEILYLGEIKTSSFQKRFPGFVVLLLFLLIPGKRIFGVGSLLVLVDPSATGGAPRLIGAVLTGGVWRSI